MIDYLTDWLAKRAGRAPVWVSFRGNETGHSFTMVAVDSVGIVLATAASNHEGGAYPWSAVVSVMPEKHKD